MGVLHIYLLKVASYLVTTIQYKNDE